MTEVEKMNLLELMKYWNDDWIKKDPSLTDVAIMSRWSDRVRVLIPYTSPLSLLEALHTLDTEGVVEEEKLMYTRLRGYLTGDHEERIKGLETIVKVLVDELGDERSKLTIKEHIKLMGVEPK